MSPSDANPVKSSSSPANTTQAAVLNWEVFVTPGIPIVTADRPAGVRETNFQAMASTLIYGARDAVLVDAFMNDHVVDCFRYGEILREFAHAKEAAQLFDGGSPRKWRTR